MSKAKFEGSKALYESAREHLVNGVGSSFHKSGVEEFPIYADHGEGSKLYDVDGNEYIGSATLNWTEKLVQCYH